MYVTAAQRRDVLKLFNVTEMARRIGVDPQQLHRDIKAGRTTKGLCDLFDELRERKADLVSIKDGFSLESPAGRLHARILASVAEYENEIRRERVLAGQAVARRKGKTWGGSEKGWRWKVSDDQVAAIHEMKAVGKPIAQIARVTGLSRPTIYRVLREVEQVE